MAVALKSPPALEFCFKFSGCQVRIRGYRLHIVSPRCRIDSDWSGVSKGRDVMLRANRLGHG